MAQSIIVFPNNVHFPLASSHAHVYGDGYLQHSSVSFPINSNRRHHPMPSIRASVFHCNNNNIPRGVAFSSKGGNQGFYSGMNGWHEIELKVREYELDKNGVVSNSVYSSYCQHGHHEIFRRLGLPSFGVDPGDAVALTDLSLKFIAPLKSGDRFVLKVRITRMSAVRIYFQHLIFKLPNHEPIMEANTTGVYVDKNHRPVRIPPAITSKICQFIIDSKTFN